MNSCTASMLGRTLASLLRLPVTSTPSTMTELPNSRWPFTDEIQRIAALAGRRAGRQARQLEEVAAEQRQILDLPLLDHLARCGALSLQQRRRRDDFDDVGETAEVEREVDAQVRRPTGSGRRAGRP